MERRLAAILAADVVGYSRLMQADEVGTLVAVKARRTEILQPLVVKHRGRIVKLMGDGVLVEFASAVNAVACALELQAAMDTANTALADDRRIVLRVGINLGDVIVEGQDLYGDGVNIAARLEGLADPGQVFVSSKVHNEVANKLSVTFEDLGEKSLKNISELVRVYRATSSSGHTDAPRHAKIAEPVKPSIAVLPFTNMSGDADQQYFSDGITEDIITELARYRSLHVSARNSSFQFRGPSVDVAAVRRALGVRYVVEGSVRKVGNRIRVTAQLIDAVSQNHLWAERYDREIQDIFAVQDQVSGAIVATLEGRIAASGAELARRKPTGEWIAYDFFLQGRECDYRYDLDKAMELFRRAIELDPEYVHAHARLAEELCMRFLHDERSATIDLAATHAEKALALDENDAYAHNAMGWVSLRRRQFDLAGQHFDRAAALNPNDVTIAIQRANWLMYVGRLDEVMQCLDSVQQRDPYPPTWIWEPRGQTLYFMRRYAEAVVAIRHMSSQHYWTPMFLAAAFAQLGQEAEAREALETFLHARPGATLRSVRQQLGYALEAQCDLLVEGLRRAGLRE